MVAQGPDGYLLPTPVMITPEGGITATSIGPPAGADRVRLVQADLTGPSITGGTIRDATSVTTTTLRVSGSVDVCTGDTSGATSGTTSGATEGGTEGETEESKGCVMTVGGGLTVYGSVVGAGPYMDSSDGRFKRDVRALSGSLGRVERLAGVSFRYLSEGYPERGFPRGEQMGWVAEDLQEVRGVEGG